MCAPRPAHNLTPPPLIVLTGLGNRHRPTPLAVTEPAEPPPPSRAPITPGKEPPCWRQHTPHMERPLQPATPRRPPPPPPSPRARTHAAARMPLLVVYLKNLYSSPSGSESLGPALNVPRMWYSVPRGTNLGLRLTQSPPRLEIRSCTCPPSPHGPTRASSPACPSGSGQRVGGPVGQWVVGIDVSVVWWHRKLVGWWVGGLVGS